VYNLVRTGDLVTATTFRKIQRESGAGQESEKVKLKLSIRVEAIDFDPEGIAPCITADFDIQSSPRQCSNFMDFLSRRQSAPSCRPGDPAEWQEPDGE
jgi:eRF1 domain 1